MRSVLLVDDNEDDVLLMKRACQRTGIPHELQVVSDGNSAVDYLVGTGIYADRAAYPLPHLVFLDIRMPGRDGHSVLKWIREQPVFKRLPVVMLTSSSADLDRTRAYDLGMTSYLHKNEPLTEFSENVKVILKYWLQVNLSHY